MTSSGARKQLLYALRPVPRPIVRTPIRAGVRCDEFAEPARGLCVESAIQSSFGLGARHAGGTKRLPA